MNYSCLIVEDSAFIREIYRYGLQNSAYHIVGEAENGEEALFKIKSLQPDIIILDLVLPLINGLDVLKKINDLSPLSKVLVVSSIDDEKIKDKAKALGAIFYLEKPFKKVELINALQKLTIQKLGEKNG